MPFGVFGDPPRVGVGCMLSCRQALLRALTDEPNAAVFSTPLSEGSSLRVVMTVKVWDGRSVGRS